MKTTTAGILGLLYLDSLGADAFVAPAGCRVGARGWSLQQQQQQQQPSRGMSHRLRAKFNKRVKGEAEFGNEDYENEGIQGGHMINWYPGHIAKAERQLKDYVKLVDVVIEVRDARIPLSTTHQKVPEWVGNRPLLVVLNRKDIVPPRVVKEWHQYFTQEGGLKRSGRSGNVPVFFVDSKRGRGVHLIKKAAMRAGQRVNDRRLRQGLNPRSVRVLVIGFPNVGKSALINHLIGKKICATRNTPGVTRSISWIRVGGVGNNPEDSLELLDTPGIIPARQDDQEQALKLAICNDIGQASYDSQVVAAAMMDRVVECAIQFPGYVDMPALIKRLKIDPRRHSGQEFVYLVAKKFYHGEMNNAADRLLGDFRRQQWGHMALEAPPTDVEDFNRIPTEEVTRSSPVQAQKVAALEDYGARAKADREYIADTGDFEGW